MIQYLDQETNHDDIMSNHESFLLLSSKHYFIGKMRTSEYYLIGCVRSGDGSSVVDSAE